MPAPDPTIPDSVILGQFSGLKNTVAPERLGPTDLQRATNVDIDDSGQIRRRRGFELELTGSWHSVKGPLAGKTYGVRDGVLGIVRSQPAFFSLRVYVGSAPVTYTEVDGNVYFSSVDASGVITPAETVIPWGQTAGQGLWFSPVYTPTDTLGEVAGTLLGDPPKATQIEAYSGRIYLAAGKVLWATELYRYHYVDRTKNYMQFEHDITLVMAVDDGLYVGTTGGLYFLRGVFGSFKLQPVISAAVLPGSGVVVPVSLVHPAAQSQPIADGVAAVFMTDDGVCAGFNGGEVHNLTQTRVLLPEGVSAASLFRQDQGINSYVAAVDSAGAPTSTARIGDYIDAEIRRFPTPQVLSLPTPVAVSDFANGVYSINGVTKTVDDLWAHDPVWAPWTTADIIPGVGFVASKSNTSYYAPGPVATDELNTAIGNEYTLVVDYEFESTGSANTICVISLTATTNPLELTGWWIINQQSGVPQYAGIGMGDFAGLDDEFPQFGLGSHKLAATMSQAKLMHCADGGVVNETTQPLQANIPNHFMLGLDANTLSINGTTVTITIRSITGYALITDQAVLKQLSR